MTDPFRLDGQAALVTGAGQGIGRAAAAALARAGAAVALVGRTADAVNEAAAAIQADGGRALAVAADVSRVEDTTGMVQRVVAEFGRLDILVTSAAAAPAVAPSERLPIDAWRAVLDIDLTGAFLACQAAAQVLLAGGYGRIVNVASFHAIATYPQRAAYAAAKAGVIGLTHVLAVEWAGRGVTANAVAPGPVRGSRLSSFVDADPSSEPAMIARTPTGRLAEPDDVVAAILFLASREAGHVNGQTIVVDGGWTRSAWWGAYPYKG